MGGADIDAIPVGKFKERALDVADKSLEISMLGALLVLIVKYVTDLISYANQVCTKTKDLQNLPQCFISLSLLVVPRVIALFLSYGAGDAINTEKYSVPGELPNLLLLTDSDDPLVNYINLLEVFGMGLVTNTETFDCPICFSDIAVGEGVTLKDCLHNFCRECLLSTIRHSDTVSVKCPFINDDYSCESFLQEREIKSLLTPDEFERHLAMSLALVERQSSNSFHCKTPDCAGWCLVENDANQFFCLVCQHYNCLSCAAIHEGKNCKQYQDMADLQKDTKTKKYLDGQLKSNKAMACPTCQVIVMKREGCDWLVCSMCQTEICWATRGPRWGPGGKGDTSGGCRCDYKSGKPCHPQCYNCH